MEHLPECVQSTGFAAFPMFADLCICTMLRNCEQRVLSEVDEQSQIASAQFAVGFFRGATSAFLQALDCFYEDDAFAAIQDLHTLSKTYSPPIHGGQMSNPAAPSDDYRKHTFLGVAPAGSITVIRGDGTVERVAPGDANYEQTKTEMGA